MIMNNKRSCKENTPLLLSWKSHKRTFVVEPVVLLYFMSVLCCDPLIQQFVYHHFSLKYGLPGISTGNTSGCDNTSSLDQDLEKKAQSDSSSWLLYITLGSAIPALISLPLLGAYCDHVGRKVTLLITIVGHILCIINSMVVIYLDLDVAYLLLGFIVLGIAGYYGAIGIGSGSYIADTTPKDQLSFRLAVLEGGIGVAAIISNIGMGYWIRLSQGFFYPFFFPLGVQLLNMLYVLLFVPESRIQNAEASSKQSNTSLAITYLTKTFKLYIVDNGTNRVCKLRIIFLSFLMFSFVDDARTPVQTLYQLNSPLCWNSIKIGYYNAITAFFLCIMTMIGIKVLSYCLHDIQMAIIACIFKIASLVLEAFATTELMMFLVPVVAFYALPAPLYKSMLSKLVAADDQGAVMSSVAFLETVCALVGSLLFNNIYSATLSFLPGFVFLVMTALCCIGVLLLFIYWCWQKPTIMMTKLIEAESLTNSH